MNNTAALKPVLPILIAAAIMLSLSFGLRQSLGLFMPSLTGDIAVTITDFTFAIAIQNLIWGIFQPLAGMFADRWGFRPVMVAGAISYVIGMSLLASANGVLMVILGAGLCVGVAMACASFAMTLSVTSRLVPASIRSTALGIVSAAGSVGAIMTAPLGQFLESFYDWRVGLIGFAILALLIVPSAWIAGRVDKEAPLELSPDNTDRLSAGAAIGVAFRHVPFVVMAIAYFVCGMQLIFITTHLPSYLLLCGMDPMLGASALGIIAGFNVLGSIFFGWAGGRWPKMVLLGMIYISRSLVIALYFMLPPTPSTTILFAAVMGFLWLGVSPLVAGSVVEMFGLRWQAMIQGFAFFSHQIGSFMGAFGGGWLFDQLGSYNLALQIGVSLGLFAGTAQIIFAFYKPPKKPLPA
ncbi:MFS transporter [uncultured Sneathiella sp.]|uniref:MFS transporter n=1 Tax=uncultured Sneathiella sp. TaxID=879315 RepID=UPI0030ED246F|tara:strand:- start:76180 stop:77406 length:1227 start_codon:yes stop_codon:yes gene_type:complete